MTVRPVRTRTNSVYALLGGQDTLIHAYEILCHDDGSVSVAASPRYSLVGHTNNVCALRTYPDYIASSAWDGTVRIWRHWTCVATLEAHAQAAWSVYPLDDDRVLSASADRTVCLWSLQSPSAPVRTFTGATQAVRDVVGVSETHVIAAGNDGYASKLTQACARICA